MPRNVTNKPRTPRDDKVTIDEWKRLYGEPGPLTDQHGRIWGYYPTEPCFCEDTDTAA